MADRPILFSAPMVRAILDGRKAQTRRVLRPQIGDLDRAFRMDDGSWNQSASDGSHMSQLGIPYAVGDRLWVREAYRGFARDDGLPPREIPQSPSFITYEATPDKFPALGKLRHGMFMPRWASRLTLTVTDVQVQRLQEISEADAVAEGIIFHEPTEDDIAWGKAYAEEHGCSADMRGVWLAPGTRQGWDPKEQRDNPQWGPTASFAYRCLWDSLNTKRGFGWDANPWVVAVTFTAEQRNIDTQVQP